MTKRHLRTWVKVAFIIILLFGWLYIDYRIASKGVQDCIAKGQIEEICDELWK